MQKLTDIIGICVKEHYSSLVAKNKNTIKRLLKNIVRNGSSRE